MPPANAQPKKTKGEQIIEKLDSLIVRQNRLKCKMDTLLIANGYSWPKDDLYKQGENDTITRRSK